MLTKYVTVLNAARAGQKIGKLARKMGATEAQAQIYSDAHALEFTRDFNEVYATVGDSCMSGKNVGDFYSSFDEIEVVTLHDCARVLVNVVARTYAPKAYGTLCGRLLAALEMLGYTRWDGRIIDGLKPVRNVGVVTPAGCDYTITAYEIEGKGHSIFRKGESLRGYVFSGERMPTTSDFIDWEFTGKVVTLQRGAHRAVIGITAPHPHLDVAR
jgi:hypothetical protein